MPLHSANSRTAPVTGKSTCIPVLMYHHVNPAGNFINVRPRIFEAQIRHLKESGFAALHTGDFLSILNGLQEPPRKPVMITFDDGWLDNWIYAFPVLKKYGMKAVIFAISSLVSKEGRRLRADEGLVEELPPHKECQKMVEEGLSSDVMLSWEEIREMSASGLIEIQSHTHGHKRWDKLYSDRKERLDVLKQDLEMSKNILEERLAGQCNALCWPWGIYDDDYAAVARSLGFELLFTTKKGTNTVAGGPWEIRRLVIGNISPFTLRKKLFIHSRGWLSSLNLKLLHR